MILPRAAGQSWLQGRSMKRHLPLAALAIVLGIAGSRHSAALPADGETPAAFEHAAPVVNAAPEPRAREAEDDASAARPAEADDPSDAESPDDAVPATIANRGPTADEAV